MDAQVNANKRRALLLAGVFLASLAVVLGGVALLVGGVVGLFLGVLVALGITAGAYATSLRVALSLARAQPADPLEHARLHNVVEGLCFASGLPKPRVCVVDDQALNAFAAGRSPKDAAVGVTTGLVANLSRVELEAVVAHELSHVKNYDVLISTLTVTMVALPASFLPASTVGRLVAAAVGSAREPVADISGVSLTRYPPGLVSALEKLRHGPSAVGVASRATAHLWIEPSEPVQTHTPLDERIEALRDL